MGLPRRQGQAVHDNAKKHGYSVVREVGGHGVGIRFHEEPFVSYVTKRGTDMLLVPGMIFTIEPMINMGKMPLSWTRRTAGRSARRTARLRAVGNHGAGHGRRARSAGVLNFHGGRLPDPGEGGRPQHLLRRIRYRQAPAFH